MFDICHPAYYNMSQLGCNDQVKLTTAFYVYMELCEVKRYWDVEYKFQEPLQLFYLEARKSKKAQLTTFIPWPAVHNISLDLISTIQKELKIDKFTFVFKDGDTTSIYYSISSEVAKPNAPEESRLLRENFRKKLRLDKEITRNAGHLFERALLLESEELGISNDSEMNEETVLHKHKDQNNTETCMPMRMDNIDKEELELTSEPQNSESPNKDVGNFCNIGRSEFTENSETYADEDFSKDIEI